MEHRSDVCIRRTFHGNTEEQTFEEFAYSTIQDNDTAIHVAERMLAGDVPYQWNAFDPEWYEEFEILDATILRREVLTYRKALGA